MPRSLLGLLLCTFAGSAAATEFVPVQAPDPLQAGGVCRGAEIMSFGSYIYQWPERFHLVFWPLTDADTYWTCDSGLVLPVGPIPELDAASKDAIAAWLATSGARQDNESEAAWRIRVAEGVAAVRGDDPDLTLKLARAHAFHVSERGSDAAHNARVALLPRIQARLADDDMPTDERWALQAVSAIYLRNVGRYEQAKAAEDELRKLLDAPLGGDDADLGGFRDYLNALIAEVSGSLPVELGPKPADD